VRVKVVDSFSFLVAMISLLQTSALLFALSITSVSAVPFLDKRSITGPVITTDFADPAIKLVGSTWYAFATGQYGKHVQVATSPDFKTWTVLNKDALPNLPSWVVPDTPTGSFVWAPDMVPRRVHSMMCDVEKKQTRLGP
jgi:hypothetical protein